MTESLLTRTAKALYRADEAPKQSDWSHIPKGDQRRYEVMAAAALSIALREPVDKPIYGPDLDVELESLPQDTLAL